MMGRLYNTGKHMWRYGDPAKYDDGRVTHRMLGPCPRCGYPTIEYGGGFSCNNQHCMNSRFVFACHTPDTWADWWDKGILVLLDGESWCAHDENFIDLQESIAGFGDTPKEAVEDYLAQCKRSFIEGEPC